MGISTSDNIPYDYLTFLFALFGLNCCLAEVFNPSPSNMPMLPCPFLLPLSKLNIFSRKGSECLGLYILPILSGSYNSLPYSHSSVWKTGLLFLVIKFVPFFWSPSLVDELSQLCIEYLAMLAPNKMPSGSLALLLFPNWTASSERYTVASAEWTKIDNQ